jgi:hypothetical protein
MNRIYYAHDAEGRKIYDGVDPSDPPEEPDNSPSMSREEYLDCQADQRYAEKRDQS